MSTGITERNIFLTILASLYIQNHPDRIAFSGTHPQMLEWGFGMGLVTAEEKEKYTPNDGSCRWC